MNGLNKFSFILLILFFLSVYTSAQEKFRIMFYNVENMYDTKDNPLTNDDDLTPEGNLRWNNYKYWKKLTNISKVIQSVGGKYPPALVGICEVENDSVLFDLTKRSILRKDKYEYIITYSNDSRGSNVALLYQRDQIKILNKKTYTPIIEKDMFKTTRDILHVTGKIVNGDTLDIFICHFPSRNDGIKRTRPYRIECARLMREKIDSTSNRRKKANIVVIGDFNDYPFDISMSEVLKAHSIEKNTISEKELYNLFHHKTHDKSIGSYKYRGKWNYIDQFVVSGSLLMDTKQTYIKDKEAHVYKAEFLFEEDSPKYGGVKPYRTYLGFKYLGGYSDHLPIYMDLIIKTPNFTPTKRK